MADEQKAGRDLQNDSQAYMNRLFCTTKERVSYILYTAFGTMTTGSFEPGGEIWVNKIYNIDPEKLSYAKAGLTVYDMVNDPLTAAIIDNMRTRWGKFKPFQWLSIIPAIILGIFICTLPSIAGAAGLDASKRLIYYMVYLYVNETVNAFFGGGGYIKNVFTPNPNERTSLLVSARFVGDLMRKLPSQIMDIIWDLMNNGVLGISQTKFVVVGKTTIWILTMIPTILWYVNSRERIAQSEKPPQPIKGIVSVFKNRPLLVYTLSGLIDDINLGMGGDLYYSDVLKFKTMTTIAGIPGSPISYASYGFVSKFRKIFSTKALWFLSRGTTFFRETSFFLVGLIGGKDKGLYQKKLPMSLTFAFGNCLEMAFYATRNIIGDEINFEVLDYCEWQNGFRVEATVEMMKGYFLKVKNMIIEVVNARLLKRWVGYEGGENAVQTQQAKYRLFITAFGPKLIFDALCFIPMFFYNIDKNTRERMYLDLERTRSARANSELLNEESASLDNVSE